MPTTMYPSPTPTLEFFTNAGLPLTGGLLFTYAGGTLVKQTTFTDSTGMTAMPNPIVLNTRGEVAPTSNQASTGLWLDPTLVYKYVLSPPGDTDPPTNAIWTIDNIVSPQAAILAQLAAYRAQLTGIPIGGMIPFGGATVPTGWQLCYGQALNRTNFAALFAVIGTSYGIGDGSTTFNVPDKRGRVSIGADNMGGTAANRVTAAVSGIDATAVGNSGGDQNAQQDTLNAVSNADTALTDPMHAHPQLLPNPGVGGDSQEVQQFTGHFGGGGPWGSITTGPASTGISASTTVTTTVSSTLTGASQNMPPTQVDSWLIFAGA